jgi:hypothetical protein
MNSMSERHEIRVPAGDSTIIFEAESDDGRLLIRQERNGRSGRQVCSIKLSDPEELAAFFKGMRRILSSLGHSLERGAPAIGKRKAKTVNGKRDNRAADIVTSARSKPDKDSRPWGAAEERELRTRFQAGESVRRIAIALDRSPGAVEARLVRSGLLQDA